MNFNKSLSWLAGVIFALGSVPSIAFAQWWQGCEPVSKALGFLAPGGDMHPWWMQSVLITVLVSVTP